MNKIYTYQQILFALRKEYLEINKKLNELKKYIVTDDNKVINSSFLLEEGKKEDSNDIILRLTRKRNLLEKLSTKLGYNMYEKYETSVTKGIKPYYEINNTKVCQVTNIDKCNKIIKEILNSDIFSEIEKKGIISIPAINDKYKSIAITSDMVSLNNGLYEIFPRFDYFLAKDRIFMEKEEETIYPADIYDILNLKFDISFLNKYHFNNLKKYINTKDVIVKNNFYSKNVAFKIAEKPKQYVLTCDNKSK